MRSRDQLLASASLAEHQHCGLRVRDHLDRLEHLRIAGDCADDLAEAPLDLDLFLQVDVLRFEFLGALAIGDVAGDERHGRMAVDRTPSRPVRPFEPTLAGQDAQRILQRLARSRLESSAARSGDALRQQGPAGCRGTACPSSLRWRSIQQVLARRQDFEITPFACRRRIPDPEAR